jgi:predicted transcriptional regulator
MANQLKQMNTVRAIIQLLSRSYSLRAISEKLNISRVTVTKYAKYCEASGKTFDELMRMDDASLGEVMYPPADQQGAVDERRAYLETQITSYVAELKRTGVTKKLLWEEYKKKVPDGYGYSQFCHVLNELLNIKDPVMHLEYEPADQ